MAQQRLSLALVAAILFAFVCLCKGALHRSSNELLQPKYPAFTRRQFKAHYLEGKVIGKASKLQEHSVVIAIRQNNIDKLRDILEDVSDMKSPNYGKHLTREEVVAMTADPSKAKMVIEHFVKKGAKLVKKTAHGEYITLRAPIGLWEETFTAHFEEVELEAGRRQVRSLEFSIPEELFDHIAYVSNILQAPYSLRRKFRKGLRDDDMKLSSIDPSLDTLSILRSFYNITESTISSNSENAQAVYADIDQSFSRSDLSVFQADFNVIPTAVIGTSNETACAFGNCTEGNLDIQYITGIAANTTTYFVNGPLYDVPDPILFVTWMVGLTTLPILPRVASISYGISETILSIDDLMVFDIEAIKLSVMGVTILAASGDDGANDPSARGDPSNCGYAPSFPSTSQYVLSIGATYGPGKNTPEVACVSSLCDFSSGGGFATHQPLPSFQASLVESYLSKETPLVGFGAGRGIPDLSLLGFTYSIIVQNALLQDAGTSAATPVMAALITLVNSARLSKGMGTLGWIHPSLYQNYALFTNDITVGNNFCPAITDAGVFTCCLQGFNATTGWDPVSGLGSIDFKAFYDFYTSPQNFGDLATQIPTFQSAPPFPQTTEFFFDTCSDTTQTAVYPLNTCVPDAVNGLYLSFNAVSLNSTTQVLITSTFSSSDCSMKAASPFNQTFSTSCSLLSSAPHYGFFTAVNFGSNCAQPSLQAGYVSGICYVDAQQNISYEFHSCGMDASYTLLIYGASTNCAGQSQLEEVPRALTCDYDLAVDVSYLSQCTTGPTASPSLSPLAAVPCPTQSPMSVTTSPTESLVSSTPSASFSSTQSPVIKTAGLSQSPSSHTASPSPNPVSTPTSHPYSSPVSAPSGPSQNPATSLFSCFAGTEVVSLEQGSFLPISEVKIGDRILSGNAFGLTRFATVISVPHGINHIQVIFLQLQLANGLDIKLTAEHLLLGGACDAPLTLVTAASLSVGDCVSGELGNIEISATREVPGKGLYTVVTEEELIVVSGVMASPFAVNHAMPHAFYHLHRVLYWIAPAVVKSAAFIEAHRVFSSLFMNASF